MVDSTSQPKIGQGTGYTWIQSQPNTPLAINPDGGNVGIGTPTPKAFQVALPESSKGGNTPGAGVTIAGGDNASIELRGTGTPYIDFAKDASTTDYHARIRLTATDKLAIEGANVGIGTTSPGAKLSFINVDDTNAGTAGITWHNSAPTMYGIHRTDGTWTSPNYQQLRLAWDTGIVLYPGTAYGKSYVDVQGGGLRVTAGNVGIGTPTAAQKLMVVGPQNAGKDPDSGMSYGGQLAIKGNAPQLDFIDTDSNDWSIHVNSNKLYFIRQPWNYTDLVLDGSGKVGIGTDGPGSKLTVSASESHLQLRREGSETTGGKKLFLELFQETPTPEVYPSIRFHHSGRFWHRIEARTAGLHIKEGSLDGDGYSDLYAGNITLNGTLAASGGVEALRILRGIINSNGTVFAGSGFSASKAATGLFDVTFAQAFPSIPGASATQILGRANTGTETATSTGGDTRDNAVIAHLSANMMRVKTGDAGGNASDRVFSFIVIGPR